MDHNSDGLQITDAELTALALAADASAPLGSDAVPMDLYLAQVPGLLSEWYMPLGVARATKGWKVPVVLIIVGTLIVLEALGLCSAYGHVIIG